MTNDKIHDAVVIGAGQYGLGVSYYLKQAGIPHRVLERGRIGESWRSQRWESFRMNTINLTTKMPDMPNIRPEPEGFCSHHEFVAHLEEFVERHELPVDVGVAVTSLSELEPELYRLETSAGTVIARNVIIATSCQNRPLIPDIATHIPPNVFQMHSAEYRTPASLPNGAVLIVGSGSSGCQIAEDLLEKGTRTIYLATSKIPRAPRRYRGHDFGYWSEASGFLYEKVENFADQSVRLRPPRMGLQSGTKNGHGLSLQSLSAQGVILLGRLKGVEQEHFLFENDLLANIQFGDDSAKAAKRRVDAFIEHTGLDAPEDVPDWTETIAARIPTPPILSLDPVAHDISWILWCTGFDGDFNWIHLPVFDAGRWPEHVGGITSLPGICFIGLHWLHIRGSNVVMGVARDAQRLAGHIAKRARVER